jgi:GNAT superfamily N-acetyltransferase
VGSIHYKQLTPEEIPEALLKNFTRYQETNRVIAVVDKMRIEREDHFIDDWGEKKLIETAYYLHDCAKRRGIVIGAFQENDCIGFAAIEPDRFGAQNQYLEMTFCHVSREYRGHGVGRKLFTLAADTAKTRGVGKLYISTHPSVESQAFYRAMGCVPAQEINQEILAREPLDIQLEITL